MGLYEAVNPCGEQVPAMTRLWQFLTKPAAGPVTTGVEASIQKSPFTLPTATES